MRDIALWLSGAALAFLITAGAFLLLANLATAPSETSLTPEKTPGGSGHTIVDLKLDRGQLALHADGREDISRRDRQRAFQVRPFALQAAWHETSPGHPRTGA